jgi:hypothetical protein
MAVLTALHEEKVSPLPWLFFLIFGNCCHTVARLRGLEPMYKKYFRFFMAYASSGFQIYVFE